MATFAPKYYQYPKSVPKAKRLWMIQWNARHTFRKCGRREQYTRRGFARKSDAETYYEKEVRTAIDAGYETPEEMYEAQCASEEQLALRQTTLRELVDQHMVSERGHCGQKTIHNKKSRLEVAIKTLGEDTLVAEIDDEQLKAAITGPLLNGQEASADYIVSKKIELQRLFNKAVKMGIREANPVVEVETPSPSSGRPRYLLSSEVGRLLAACVKCESRYPWEFDSIELLAFVACGLYIGHRLSETLHLEYHDLNEEAGIVSIIKKPHLRWRPKWGKERTVYPNPELFQYIHKLRDWRVRKLRTAEEDLNDLLRWQQLRPAERRDRTKPRLLAKYKQPPGIQKLIENARGNVAALRCQVHSSLVFPSKFGTPLTECPKALENAIEEAKLNNVSHHTLRHTFASHLAQSGKVTLMELKELLGHSDIRTTMRYAHLLPDHAAQKAKHMPLFEPAKDEADGSED